MYKLVILVSAAAGCLAYKRGPELPHHGRCEPITVSFCKDIPYNETIMPNILNHAKQEDAGHDVYQFSPLVKIKCNPDLQFFLCSVYVPLCTILEKPIQPCRSLCLSARRGCDEVMSRFGFPWPEALECSQFPDPPKICVGMNNTTAPPVTETRQFPSKPQNVGGRSSMDVLPAFPEGAMDLGFVCPVQFKVPKGLDYTLKVGDKVVKDCAAPCQGMFFTPEQINYSRLWVGSWSALCLLSCLFTVLTFLIDTERFRYPERPIVFLSLCYLMVAASYLAGAASGNSASCRKPFPPPLDLPSLQMVSTVTQGTKHEPCTILFMLLYFFGMASSIWWVILTLTWFLAAGLKWGHEAIEANCQYFHLAAWAVPAVKTITILAMGKVEGDILTGVCYVGLMNAETLRSFVLIPLFVYLVLGTIFLLAGFVSLFRIRTVMKHDGTKTDKLEKLMIRISVFSVMYTVPALVVLACLFYEQAYMDSWMLTWNLEMCSRPGQHTPYSIPCPIGERARGLGQRPEFKIFMIKYLMYLVVGLTSSLWIWSPKTLASWKGFFHRPARSPREDYL